MMESEEVINYTLGEDIQKGHLQAITKIKISEDKTKTECCHKNYELLGSVTTENSPGVRTSARVIQKMKENSCRPITPPPTELKMKEDKSLQKTPSQQKPTRVIWTNLERNFFFDALNEYGKDFESIANYINTKLKRKNITDQCFKTKEQIRTIYYQTFHKLSSKYIKFSDDVKKPIQELYALINYGEMRRKLQFVSEKNCMKIKDLVYKGYVTVRSKGKNIRVKTPSCKALRKLNQLEDWLEDIKLPPKVEVCLRPASMETWARVQNIAQNPVIRTSVPLQKKLINIIKTFQHKWRSRETNLILEASKISYANLNIINNNNNNTNNNNNHNNNIDNLSKNDQMTIINNKNVQQNILDDTNIVPQEPLICLRPLPDAIVHRPLVSITELLSSLNICLNSYEERIGVTTRGETLCHERLAHKRQRSDSGCEKKSPELKKLKLENDEQKMKFEDDIKPLKSELNQSIDCSDENDFAENFLEIISDDNNHIDVNDICKTDQNYHESSDSDNKINCSGSSSNCSGSNNNLVNSKKEFEQKIRKSKCSRKREIKKEMSNLRSLVNDDVIRKIRKGWTILNAGDITIGDLYIVFGQDLKLIFEYHWLEDENLLSAHDKSTTIFATGMVQFNTSTHDNESVQKHQIETINKIRDSKLSNKLKQLLLIANLSDRMKRKSCSCGHSCDNRFSKTRIDSEIPRSFVANKPPFNNNNNNDDSNVFRQPLAPFRKSVLSFDSLKQIANNLRLKKSEVARGNITGSRQLIVQRLLPVQPGLNQSYDVVEVKNNLRTVEEITQIDVQNENNLTKIQIENVSAMQQHETDNQTKGIQVDIYAENDSIIDKSVTNSEAQVPVKTANNHDEPDLSALMELSLPSPIPINKYLDEISHDNNSFISIPPMSPMHLLRENSSETRWLEENFNDFSLSSLLGHLDEVNNGRDITNVDSNMPSNMSVISETSVDYTTKFAEIAASMKHDEKEF